MKARRRFSYAFKLAAVKKVVEQGLTVAEVAKELNLAQSQLHGWKRQMVEQGEVGRAPLSAEQELKQLREENRRLKMERDILKKATAFFANQKE